MKFCKDEILNSLLAKQAKSGPIKISKLNKIFDISPEDFIKFANDDLESSIDHKAINALSNAKRALDCQMDSLLLIIGFYDVSQKKRWGFPKKLEKINEFEIIAPRILKKISKQRNLLEHQFIFPNINEVDEFIDIATLFIAGSDKYVKSFISQFQIN